MAVTVQQAAANAFASWLAGKLTGVTVEAKWPPPDKKKPEKSVTVITAGRRRDTPIDLRLLKKTNVGDKQTRAVWQVAACTQPFQLDVWALSEPARDDLLAQLDVLLHAGESSLAGLVGATPAGNGNLIAVGDGWEDCGTVADFIFSEPDLETTSDNIGRSIYRATFRGDANLMLAVTTLTARQTAINFQLRISETDTPSDFP